MKENLAGDNTPYSTKCSILSELWMSYRLDSDFADFVEYNDIGLPLAYVISEGIVQSTDLSKRFVEETFDLLLAGLDKEDTGFETLEDILD